MEITRREMLASCAVVPLIPAMEILANPEDRPDFGIPESEMVDIDGIVNWMKSLPKTIIFAGEEFKFDCEVTLRKDERIAMYSRIGMARPQIFDDEPKWGKMGDWIIWNPMQDIQVTYRVGVNQAGEFVPMPASVISGQKVMASTGSQIYKNDSGCYEFIPAQEITTK